MLIKKKLRKLGKEESPPVEISEDLDIKELTENYKIKDFQYKTFKEEEKEEILYPLLKENAPVEKILEEVFKELPPEVKEKISMEKLEEKIEEVRLGGKETAKKFFASLIEEEEEKGEEEKVVEKEKKGQKTAKDFFSFE